jgi:serine/threonine-protein kinase
LIAGATVKPLSNLNLRFLDAHEHASGETLTMLKVSGSPRSVQDWNSRRAQTGAPGLSILAAGQELGSYRLLECLGRGAQGEVWKARLLEPEGGIVALKILTPSSALNAARIAQFRREAERGLRLVGPSLLTIRELKASDGYHFMTMPLVEGTSLRDVIKSRIVYLLHGDAAPPHPFVSLDENDYLLAMTDSLAEAARAMGRVHIQRIAHRDIKPANILLDNLRPGGVYLCDFGLGRDLDFATTDQMRDGAGTPLYMAPERLLKLPADEIKCDIYSMGVTLFEALTLARPFCVPESVGPAGLAPFLAAAEPRRPRQVHRRFPGELEEIITKAMARDPHRRHDSAVELAADLELYVRGRASGPRRERSQQPRHPLVPHTHFLPTGAAVHHHTGSDSLSDSSALSHLGTPIFADPVNDSLAG